MSLTKGYAWNAWQDNEYKTNFNFLRSRKKSVYIRPVCVICVPIPHIEDVIILHFVATFPLLISFTQTSLPCRSTFT